jgi:hypothetical protein
MVTITINSLLGTTVAMPVSGHFGAGKHQASMDMTLFSPGIYIVSLVAGTTRLQEKIVVQ